ncbi:hypothetical protein FACS18949_02990 [Clostridia bacterium]|nr:hypothetical protein FACS18949_02990 [Clostridia bacterium]
MSKMETVLNYALMWQDYVEKASPNYQYYDEKAANPGNSNWTRFGKIYDDTFFSGKRTKDGYAWCAMFVASCIIEKLGVEAFKTLLHNSTQIQWTAGVDAYKNIAKANGEWHEVKGKTPRPAPKRGDLIIFSSGDSACAHIGFVTGADASKVYTVEGNTSSNPGVVANGGAVRQKSYPLSYANIYGYCRLPWDKLGDATPAPPTVAKPVTRPQIHKGDKGDFVKECQTALNKFGYKLAVDGSFGPATDAAVRAFQKSKSLAVDGWVGPKTWASLLSA